MSDFARRQLEKYGWTDGKGLGKEENGITKPIKAVVKTDTSGVGHDRVNVLASRWWCDVFNETSKRVNVVNNMVGVQLSSEKPTEDPKLLSNKTKQKFIKAETITEYNKIPTDADESVDICASPHLNLNVDFLYKKCDGVSDNDVKPLKAKHKRIQRQDAMYAQNIRAKRKVSKKYETVIK